MGISGINAEVMPGQWEFQVGPLAPLVVADERIASEIRDKIERGALAPGSRLPGVPQLQKE
ncbi:hypothetical protein SZN_38108, partial [Streptomyces zinciresistens K42]